jgi:tRNA pseudouridine55 synthase
MITNQRMMDTSRSLLREGEVMLIRKPRGWTSFDVVNKVRSLFHCKVGHAGTLDPMATGLLIVCTGAKTKEMESFLGLEKEYRATMILGARTASFDAESPVLERRSVDDITGEKVLDALRSFVGAQTQLPPMWSAAKVGGKRLYTYARKGTEVERRLRDILVTSITPGEIDIPEVQFSLVVSKGTYVRTLVDDIGKRLGCGAYLSALERTRIGDWRVEDAVSMEDLIRYRFNEAKSLS